MKLTDPGSIVFTVSLLTSVSIRFAPLLRLPVHTIHRKPLKPLVYLLGTHKFWSPPCLSKRHPKERRSRKTCHRLAQHCAVCLALRPWVHGSGQGFCTGSNPPHPWPPPYQPSLGKSLHHQLAASSSSFCACLMHKTPRPHILQPLLLLWCFGMGEWPWSPRAAASPPQGMRRQRK